MEGGGGHGLISATLPARPMTHSSLRLYSCGLIHVYYLSVSFSYLRPAVGVSFDIKKARRKPYSWFLLNKLQFCSDTFLKIVSEPGIRYLR